MLFDFRSLWKKRYLSIAIILLLAVLISFLLLAAFMTGDTIRKGIKIEETDVSGLKMSDAKLRLLNGLNEKYRDGSFTLSYGSHKWTYGLDEISYGFLLDDVVEKAYSLGRTGSVFQKVFTAVGMAMNGHSLVIDTNYDKNSLIAILNKIKNEVDVAEKDAGIKYEKGNMEFIKETTGKLLDIDRNEKLVENHLGERDFDDIRLVVDNIQPAILYENIKNIDSVISSFNTKFNPGDKNRSDNIRLACSRINGRILLPGDEFSMNDTLGPRTVENGYKDAPVIFKNELISGPGGGICQVTTTVYDTVLKAKLDVLERSHHSMPLGYVSPGQDATIAEGSIDFRFRNSLDYPICLAASVKGDTIDIRILSKRNLEAYVVKLTSVITGEYPPGEDEIQIDDTLADDERIVVREARKGTRVILYRDTCTRDGKLVEREKISEDYYKPVNGLIKVSSNYYYQYLNDRGVSE